MIAQEPSWYIFPDGRLDMAKLMTAFQGFFQEHSEHWSQWFDYKEAGPQLLLQAFLQRIVNGGGEIHREYGLGRKRTDLLVVWPPRQHVHASTSPAEAQRFVLELKRIHHSLERTISEGLQQTSDYMDRCAGSEGHLILFSKDRNESWANKLFCRSEEFHGRTITVWGM
jgi:hypothetical protein